MFQILLPMGTGKFRYMMLVTLFAFVLNALLPFFAVYNTSAIEESRLSALFGGKVLICTAEGFRLIPAEDLQNGNEHPAPHPEYQCALCVVAAHGLKSLDSADAATVAYHPFISSFHYSTAFRTTAPEQRLSTHASTRAPPFSMAA